MHFSTSTCLFILSAALTPVSAWQATLTTDSICSAKDNTQCRILSGEVKGGCHVLGQDMPGTSCTKYTQGGEVVGACDGEEFNPWAILVQPDTA
ncbi:hypothetical protein ACHAPU_006190 [Fusarium lateritium]